MTVWRARSKKRWTMGIHDSLIEKYPDLAGLLTDGESTERA
jgi:hypothetical protein